MNRTHNYTVQVVSRFQDIVDAEERDRSFRQNLLQQLKFRKIQHYPQMNIYRRTKHRKIIRKIAAQLQLPMSLAKRVH